MIKIARWLICNRLGAPAMHGVSRMPNVLLLPGVLLLLVLALLIPAAIADDYWDRKQQEYRDNLREFDRQNADRQRIEQLHNQPAAAPTFAAIAYSKSTSKWGYSSRKQSQKQAELDVIRSCGAPDAELLVWSRDSYFCALAKGPPGSYGGGTGESLREAEAAALKKAATRGPGSKIIFFIRGNSTNGVTVSEWKPDGTSKIDSPSQINLSTVAPRQRR